MDFNLAPSIWSDEKRVSFYTSMKPTHVFGRLPLLASEPSDRELPRLEYGSLANTNSEHRWHEAEIAGQKLHQDIDQTTAQLREIMNSTRTLLMIGNGYHQYNMELLGLVNDGGHGFCRPDKIFASSHLISTSRKNFLSAQYSLLTDRLYDVPASRFFDEVPQLEYLISHT